MTRHKKELMECARMLKLGNLTEHLEELLHQAQEKQLTYPEFLLACLREEIRNRKDLHVTKNSETDAAAGQEQSARAYL